ncbi:MULTISPECIES: YvrJ family protein [Bacillaceae]|uniref:YvrJ family protein n=1 Tax=Bacillaceae TaxID=186817 RepID=UPI001C871548|nr:MULTISPECIES: YvrJ family protein [Bacillaceae]
MLEGTNVVGWFNLISNIGFPTVVALYLLFQFEKRLVNLESSIQEIGEHLEERNERHGFIRKRAKSKEKE